VRFATRSKCLPVFSIAVVVSIGSLSCSGVIGDASGTGSPTTGGVPGAKSANGSADPSTGAPHAASCAEGTTRGASRESVRRLTREELRATLADLLPTAAPGVESDIDEFPNDGDYLDGFQPFYTAAQASQWLSVADKVGGLVAIDAAARSALSKDACLASATITATCWQTVLRAFLPRALRRPVTSDEVAKLAGYAAGKDAAAGTQALVARILLSPDFLFRLVSGGATEPSRVRLTDHEVASRISYAVVGSMPDAVLSAAADGGQLQTLAEVEAQVKRLLEAPRAKLKIQRFFGEWMQVDRISSPDTGVYAQWAKLPGQPTDAKAQLQQDIADFVEGVVWKEHGSFRELMSKRSSYTKSDMLQAIYQTSATVTQGTAYATASHAGLPFRAGLLAGSDLNTNPIHRGASFLKRFMCVELPPPDPVAVAKAQQVLQTLDPHTTPNYQRVSKVTAEAACQGCHGRINPTGFLFESYDQVGRWRTVETYIENVNGMLKTDVTHPLPGPVSGLNLGDGLPTTFASALDLADGMAASGAARDCMSAFILRNIEQRRETELDQCALDEAAAVLAEDRPALDAFVKSVANEDIFWRAL
jgi:Protein of unknown function (DUF1592)/Protein of unknown function (DUF1588)/Protein of unknown function (DUF1595)/Protein of unknown function (DUF1587)